MQKKLDQTIVPRIAPKDETQQANRSTALSDPHKAGSNEILTTTTQDQNVSPAPPSAPYPDAKLAGPSLHPIFPRNNPTAYALFKHLPWIVDTL